MESTVRGFFVPREFTFHLLPHKQEVLYLCGNSFSLSFFKRTMTTSIEELRTLVAQSILSTEAFKEQLAASQEAADRRAAEADRFLRSPKPKFLHFPPPVL